MLGINPIMRSGHKAEFREIVYERRRWELLERMRREALGIMRPLQSFNLAPIIYGSIARGDVDEGSDLDVFIPNPISSTEVELAVEMAGFRPIRRVLVQATPSYAPKGYLFLEEGVSISFPLVRLRAVEREFYKFAGELDLSDALKGIRRPGVNKELLLIEPREYGHVESPVVGRESYVAGLLGISPRTVMDRVRALGKRSRVGRTGLFIERELGPEENFESALAELEAGNPALRRRLRSPRSI